MNSKSSYGSSLTRPCALHANCLSFGPDSDAFVEKQHHIAPRACQRAKASPFRVLRGFVVRIFKRRRRVPDWAHGLDALGQPFSVWHCPRCGSNCLGRAATAPPCATCISTKLKRKALVRMGQEEAERYVAAVIAGSDPTLGTPIITWPRSREARRRRKAASRSGPGP